MLPGTNGTPGLATVTLRSTSPALKKRGAEEGEVLPPVGLPMDAHVEARTGLDETLLAKPGWLTA